MSRAAQLHAALDRAHERVAICRRNLESLGHGSGEVYERRLRKLTKDLDDAERNAAWLAHQRDDAMASAEG